MNKSTLVRNIIGLLRQIFGLAPLPEPRQYELSALERDVLKKSSTELKRRIEQNLNALAR